MCVYSRSFITSMAFTSTLLTRTVVSAIIAVGSISACSAALTFSGNRKDVIPVTPESSTGLNEIYVIDDAAGVTASYTGGKDVKWYRFSSMGGAYAEEITPVVDGSTTKVLLGKDDMGYIIEDGTRRYYYWIVNYANHELTIDSADISADSDCNMTIISTQGTGDRIVYYTINGAPKELSRDIEVAYSTLSYDAESSVYRQVSESETFSWLQPGLRVNAPLCDTEFIVTGDRFLLHWGSEIEIVTPVYHTIAVAVECYAEQTERDSSNEMTEETALGGSAPCEITFKAITSDAVIFKEWQMSSDPDFGIIDMRFNDNDMTYVFRDYGTTYVRFMASNAEGSCDAYSETYEVQVGESRIECPNAFSPGASEGVNDEWKVSYKSIIDFECHIFNSWGLKMASFTDPSLGWDGKYNGKLVPAGVYYYVIRALGADGKKYKLSGDINIINYTGSRSSGTSSDGTF